MKKQIEAITKGELKFWIMIIGVIIGGVVMFTRLESKVEAMVSREQVNKSSFMQVIATVNEIKETVIEINTNQKHIMRELGIN